MEIRLKEYKKEYDKDLENIIRKTWNYDEFASRKTAEKLARVYLSSCLSNSTFSCIAVDGEKTIGIILANNRKKKSRSMIRKFDLIKKIIALISNKEGRKISKMFGSVVSIDKDLLGSINKEYEAEISFFAIDENYRGKGIGGLLFKSVLEYIKEEKLKDFYLFTDTSCNYKFYEHQGMKRKCEKEKLFNINGKDIKMKFFIYDYLV